MQQRLLIPLLSFLFTLTALGENPPNWTEPFPPHKIAGNLYYVGSKDLASFLIATPEGHILINSSLEESVPLIRASIEQLGFKFSDVKFLLISHAHSDHCAGSAEILKQTHAKYCVMDEDAAAVEDGGSLTTRLKASYMSFPPAKVDRRLKDGDKVELGGSTLTAHLTPGHTRGCTTWTMEVDGLHAVIIGSPNVNPGYILVGNEKYPSIATDYEKTFSVLKSLPVDLFLGAHGGYYGMIEKQAKLASAPSNPFIDPAGYAAYVADREKAFRNVLKKQQGEASGFDIQLDTISSGFDKKSCWVHPRAGAIPGSPPQIVLTMQKAMLSGSDIFYALNEMRTADLGKTWTGPTEHTETLGRREEPEGITVAASDFWPKWHQHSGKLLGIGHTVRYQDNKVMPAPIRRRETAYSVYDPETHTWTAWASLAMPNEPRFFNSGAGCVQRVDLPDGDILLPVYFSPQGGKYSHVAVLRCGFDGTKMWVKEVGNELAIDTDRGLHEPSLAVFKGRYYLTIRHDKRAYVTTSEDGLHFGELKSWTWDDGSDLGSYNTQAHWVTQQDALYLVYTRRGANNDHVMRHRAPLFISKVDPKAVTVIRADERELVPQRGARLGNFGITEVNENETWVTVSEWMQTTGPDYADFTQCMKYGSNNAVFASRIQWRKPNTTWNQH